MPALIMVGKMLSRAFKVGTPPVVVDSFLLLEVAAGNLLLEVAAGSLLLET